MTAEPNRASRTVNLSGNVPGQRGLSQKGIEMTARKAANSAVHTTNQKGIERGLVSVGRMLISRSWGDYNSLTHLGPSLCHVRLQSRPVEFPRCPVTLGGPIDVGRPFDVPVMEQLGGRLAGQKGGEVMEVICFEFAKPRLTPQPRCADQEQPMTEHGLEQFVEVSRPFHDLPHRQAQNGFGGGFRREVHHLHVHGPAFLCRGPHRRMPIHDDTVRADLDGSRTGLAGSDQAPLELNAPPEQVAPRRSQGAGIDRGLDFTRLSRDRVREAAHPSSPSVRFVRSMWW